MTADNDLNFVTSLKGQALYDERSVIRYFCFNSVVLHLSPPFPSILPIQLWFENLLFKALNLLALSAMAEHFLVFLCRS
jgi:hypothetical protein